jgi:hypothetical protein
MVHGLDNVLRRITFLAPPTRTTSSTQQKFMFTVLNEHLQTDMGKTLVRKYCYARAQKISADLKAYMSSSSVARQRRSLF